MYLYVMALGLAVGAGLAARLLVPCCSVWVIGIPLWFKRNPRPHGLWWFGLGMLTVVIPLTWGVGLVVHWITRLNTVMYAVEGAVFLALGLYAWRGGRMILPMRHPLPSRGPFPFTLGMVSGAASSCCLPLAASAVNGNPSFLGITGLATAYALGLFLPFWIMMFRFRWLSGRLAILKRWNGRIPPRWATRGPAVIFLAAGVFSLWLWWSGGGLILL